MSAGLLGTCELQSGAIAMPLNLATDIWPLFRDSPDLDSMQGYDLDLSSYDEVIAGAPEIYARPADCRCLQCNHAKFTMRTQR
jgi:hypothetical protein